LAESKQEEQEFDRDTFNLKKLNEREFRKYYKIEIKNSFLVWRT